jgi:hypothetical protein
MNLYRHVATQQLYTLEHLLLDHHHLNRNAFAGIYAYPYNHQGPVLTHLKQEQLRDGLPFSPDSYVQENFQQVAFC